MTNETPRALIRAVMLGMTALCLVTVGVAAVPAASATPLLPQFEPQCVKISGTLDWYVCSGPGGTD